MPLPAFSEYTENVGQISFATNKRIFEKLKDHDAELLPVNKRI
jgi:hypothetical protein